MKKTYITPSLEEIEIKTQQMLAASVGVGSDLTNVDEVLAPMMDEDINFDDYIQPELDDYFN